MTIPLHDPNENDLVCQGQFTGEDLRISGGQDTHGVCDVPCQPLGLEALMRSAAKQIGIDPRAPRDEATLRYSEKADAGSSEGCSRTWIPGVGARVCAVASNVNRALRRSS
jgi:hypothetical protein